MTLTPAEKLVDRTLAEQRAKGRRTHGQGLDHRTPLDWQSEALQEVVDALQYLAAENLRLKERVADLEAALKDARNELSILPSHLNDPSMKWPTLGLRVLAKAHARSVARIDDVLRRTNVREGP